MTQHTELIERLHASSRWWFDRGVRNSVDADVIAALEAQALEIERLRKDAERYRLLRECGVDSYEACGSGDKLDAECDAAIAMKGQP